MKKLIILTALICIAAFAFSQKVNYKKWSDPIAFQTSPTPIITGFGEYSDSLSDVYDGKTFFANQNEYYQIESWADYYYWFTQKYWYKFEQPEIYEYFYLTENDYEMARYIATQYRGKYYPSKIQIELRKSDKYDNRTQASENFAQNVKSVYKLKKDLKNPINSVNVRTYTYDKPKKNQSAKAKINSKPFDYENPHSSGIRTFKRRGSASSSSGRSRSSSSSGSSRSQSAGSSQQNDLKR